MVDHSTITPDFWKKVTPLLKLAVDRSHGRQLLSQVLHQILTGYQQLFIAFTEDNEIIGFVITQLMNYPNKRNLALHFLGGERLDDWAEPMLELIEKWANSNGCDMLEATGRPGLWSKLKHHGWSKAYVVFEKGLENG